MGRRRRPKLLIASLLICLMAVAVSAAAVGWLVGTGTNSQEFTPAQEDFMRGLVYGNQLRYDVGFKSEAQRRGACAGQFYPINSAAMAGCIEGLHDPPPGGYKFPS